MMGGITQKSCVTLFPLWSFKKNFFFFDGGRGGGGQNRYALTEIYEKFKIEI